MQRSEVMKNLGEGVCQVMNKAKEEREKEKKKWICEQFGKLEQSLQSNKDKQFAGK